MAWDNIDDALNEIKKDATKIVKDAVKKAAAQAQKEVMKTADACLQTYYSMYKPKKYKRTYSLHKAITPIFEEKAGFKNNLQFVIGVKYDANKLTGLYKSNSWYHQTGTEWIGRDDPYFDFDSQNNGLPEPWWVMENYLEGVHPWAQTDPVSTDAYMSNFFEHVLPDKINAYVIGNMAEDIISRL